MEERKATLKAVEEALEMRFRPLVEMLVVSHQRLEAMVQSVSAMTQRTKALIDEEGASPKPRLHQRRPVAGNSAIPPRKSVPTALLSPRGSFPSKQSMWANRNHLIATAAATTRRKTEDVDLKSKPAKSVKATKASPSLRKPTIARGSPRKKSEDLNSIPSVSEFAGTAFPDTDDVHDVSGVSPIEGYEAHSRASGEDIAIIEQELAVLP